MDTLTSTSGKGGWASPLFCLLLKLYPPSFRSEYGSDMAETFSDKLLAHSGGLFRRLWFLCREFSSIGTGALRIRWNAMVKGVSKKRGRQEPMGFHEPPPSRRVRDLLPDLAQDFRQALKSLGRRPGASSSGVLALGMGIGLTTLMFSVIYAAAFRPLPVPDGHRIAHIEVDNPLRGEEGLDVRPHDLADWQAQQSSFEALGGFYTASVNLAGEVRPERVFGAFVTPNTFEILRVSPAVGRGFLPEDGRWGAPPVAIISHGVWQNRFGGGTEVVGSQIRINGEVTTVVGIMPDGFGFPYWQEVWLPLKVDLLALARDQGPGMEVFGRLREGVSLKEAITEFRGINGRLAQSYPGTNEGMEAVIEPYTLSYLGPEARPGFMAMFLTVCGVLLIACFNVANLLMALAVTRIKDLAIRVAVGAGRRRVMVKVLQESLILAVAGAMVGVFLALGGIEALNRYIVATATYPPPFWMVFKLDAPILLFVVGATGACALASGLLPALRASKADVSSLLQENTRSGGGLRMGRISRLMVTAEIMVTATLLVVSAHLALDVLQTGKADYGMPVEEVLTARFGLFEELVPTQEERLALFDQLQNRLEEHTEVKAAALATVFPGVRAGRRAFMLLGEDYREDERLPLARAVRVSPGFFDALDVPVLQGREFTRSDDLESEPVAVVNESFVARYLPDVNPLGTQIRLGDPEDDLPWLTVVGVVPDLHMDGAMDPAGNPEGIYRPIAQGNFLFLAVMVRTHGDPMAFVPTLRDEVMALQRDTPIFFPMTLREAINIDLLDFILIGSLFGAFAMAAFLMAALGLYSLTAFLASQRTRELGLRMALGAGSGKVLSLVLRGGLGQILIGLALGIGLAALGRIVMAGGGGWAPEWNTPLVLIVSSILALTGLAAVLTPAIGATRVDPVEALRKE